MKLKLFLLLAVIAVVSCSQAQTPPYNPFGVLANAADNVPPTTSLQIKTGKLLGVQYLRTHVILSDFDGNIPGFDNMVSAGFKVILNINYGEVKKTYGLRQPVPFPTDMPGYKSKLNRLLDKYKPALVVIENEETNGDYHSGTAQQYLTELQTAIDIVHAHGLKAANGALTTRAVALMVWKDYYDRGMISQAQDFARRAIGGQIAADLPSLSKHAALLDKLNMGEELVKAYKTMDIDYINFHWYEPSAQRVGGAKKGGKKFNNDDDDNTVTDDNAPVDTRALEEVVSYLQRVTGKQVMTNEIGQLNHSPALITAVMQKLYDLKLPFVIWYSGDGGEGKAVSLHNGSTGDLKPNGQAFADFIKKNCQH